MNENNNTNPAAGDEKRRQAIRECLLDLVSKDNIAATTISAPKLPAYLIKDDNTALRQFTKKCQINSKADNFAPIFETTVYPGCVVYANQKLLDGYPQEVDFAKAKQLGKVTVFMNFYTGTELSEHNVPADAPSVRKAIGRLLETGLKNGAIPPAQVSEVRNTYSNIQKMAIDMDVSADFLNVKCKVDTSITSNSSKIYQMDSFTQAFYTVMVQPEDKDKSNYFGANVTAEDIRKAAKKAPLAVITSVTYGRRGFYKKEYDSDEFKFTGSESISYKEKNSISSTQDITRTSTATNQLGMIYGGNANTAGEALNPDDFNAKMKTKMVVSKSNQGIPINYTVQYLASGDYCKSIVAGEYNEISYTPAINSINYRVEQSASVLRGTNTVCLKLFGTVEKIDKDGNVIGTREVALLGDGGYDWSDNATHSFKYNLGQNEYFKDNKLKAVLKSRKSAVSSWNTKAEGMIDITSAANGMVNIKITGSYRNSLDLSNDEIKKNGEVIGHYLGFISSI